MAFISDARQALDDLRAVVELGAQNSDTAETLRSLIDEGTPLL
jgi:hypothetical protein